MGRRIRWLGLVLLVCFAAVLVQLVNIQFRKATALDHTRTNPRNFTATNNDRGRIIAADGAVLAQSVKVPGAKPTAPQYRRTYATGPLFSGVVGYSSAIYGTQGTEYTYNTDLKVHTQQARTLGQLLNPPGPTTDTVHLTIIPALQRDAQHELASIPDANQDGAVVMIQPKTGDILADYSSPTFTNNVLATPTPAKQKAARQADFFQKDHEGFYPGYPMATFDTFAPGSTFKVVTSTAVYNLRPTLANFTFKVAGCTAKGQIPQTTKQICNDSTTATRANPCGGTISQMLPESCDPGYAMLGLAIGGPALYQQAKLFGYDRVPPVDLTPVSKSNFPTPAQLAPTGPLALPGVALSAFGQETVTSTALQGAMVASGIADTGTVMAPHVMAEITNPTTGVVKRYAPTVYSHAATPAAAQTVNGLMQGVAKTPRGTAYGVGFPATEEVAVKTGTAQSGVAKTSETDWMIGFAPASNPIVAIAVVVPQQAVASAGATIAGPIVKAMLADAFATLKHGPVAPPPPTTTTPTLPPTTTTTAPGSGPPVTLTTTPATTTTTVPAPATTTPTTAPATTPTTPTTGGALGAPAAHRAGAAPATALATTAAMTTAPPPARRVRRPARAAGRPPP